MNEQHSANPSDLQPSNRVSVVLTATAWSILTVLVGLLVVCEVRGGQPFNFTDEDGLVEWGTVIAFTLCAALALTATLGKRSSFSGRQRGFMIVLAVVALIAVGEEVSWGQRLFGFKPPEGMSGNSDSVLRFGHDDVTWHNLTIDLGFMKFSLGGVLFSLPLLLGVIFHGLLLPWSLRAKKRWAQRFVAKTGIFIPSLPLGVALMGGTVFLHFRGLWKHAQGGECKEFFVPAVYALLLIECLWARPNPNALGETGQ
ncbi:MAG: hypothetical protein QGH60_13830 [Phycisphaerae bacterium]|jgi:hypothetical protein|nr:hypothetical protein [Phycisphaerae bacterium]